MTNAGDILLHKEDSLLVKWFVPNWSWTSIHDFSWRIIQLLDNFLSGSNFQISSLKVVSFRKHMK